MAVTTTQDHRDLQSLVTRKVNAVRWGHPAATVVELDNQIKHLQVRRELCKLADLAAALPAEDRQGLATYLAERLGVAA